MGPGVAGAGRVRGDEDQAGPAAPLTPAVAE